MTRQRNHPPTLTGHRWPVGWPPARERRNRQGIGSLAARQCNSPQRHPVKVLRFAPTRFAGGYLTASPYFLALDALESILAHPVHAKNFARGLDKGAIIDLCAGTDLNLNEQQRFNGGYLFLHLPSCRLGVAPHVAIHAGFVLITPYIQFSSISEESWKSVLH